MPDQAILLHQHAAVAVAFAQALAGQKDRTGSLRDTLIAPAILIIGGDPTIQAPGTAWNIRTNVRNNRARVYVANSAEIKLRRQAKSFLRLAPFGYSALSAGVCESSRSPLTLPTPPSIH